jgi:hypothetical protein
VVTVVEEATANEGERVSSPVWVERLDRSKEEMNVRVPELVSSLDTLVEVLVVSSVELIQTERREKRRSLAVSPLFYRRLDPIVERAVKGAYPSRMFLQA